jgi:hypothetical protein
MAENYVQNLARQDMNGWHCDKKSGPLGLHWGGTLLDLKADGACNTELVVWRSDRLVGRLRPIPAMVWRGGGGRL